MKLEEIMLDVCSHAYIFTYAQMSYLHFDSLKLELFQGIAVTSQSFRTSELIS